MNVLVVHNRYREQGGEDRVVELEGALLTRHGHNVVEYIEDNARVSEMARPALAMRTLWNVGAYRHVRTLIAHERIDVLHVHNTLPLVSPSVLYAAHAEGVPVVHTLHNYRLFCPAAVCFRKSAPCMDCAPRRVAIPAVRHACYRRSVAATATVAVMLWAHKAARTWENKVDLFIAPSELARSLFIGAGFDADRIVVKPHFVDPDPGAGTGRGGYAIYVGRLSHEKGVEILLQAWARLRAPMPLLIVGDGPLAPHVSEATSRLDGIRWLGSHPHDEVQRLIGEASFLIFPSLVYETFGQVIGEAYAAGTPVIASSGGAAAELVEPHQTGLLARPGDADDLAAQIEWLLAHPDRLAAMRPAARLVYHSRLSSDANYRQLIHIYDAARRRGVASSTRGTRPEAA